MTEYRTLGEDDFRALLAALRDTSWSWREPDVPALAARLGWHTMQLLPGLGAFVDPGHGLGSEAFRMPFNRGEIQRVTMEITSSVDEKDPADQAFLSGAFEDALTTATEVLGAPTTPPAGSGQEARWRGAEATLILSNLAVVVTLEWTPNAFQDTWDAATRR
jgi:hypothetical protein